MGTLRLSDHFRNCTMRIVSMLIMLGLGLAFGQPGRGQGGGGYPVERQRRSPHGNQRGLSVKIDDTPDGPNGRFPPQQQPAGPNGGFPPQQQPAGPNGGFFPPQQPAGPNGGFSPQQQPAGPNGGFWQQQADFDCVDNTRKCSRWAVNGWCSAKALKRSHYMLNNCKKSCKLCQGGGAINAPHPDQPPPAWVDPFWATNEGPTPSGPGGESDVLIPGIQWKDAPKPEVYRTSVPSGKGKGKEGAPYKEMGPPKESANEDIR